MTDYEQSIYQDPHKAYQYVFKNKKRFIEAEPIIMEDPCFAYLYSKNFLKSRWIEAEPIIMEDPHSAYCYSLNILKSRWIDAEYYMAKEQLLFNSYINYFNLYNDPIIKDLKLLLDTGLFY